MRGLCGAGDARGGAEVLGLLGLLALALVVVGAAGCPTDRGSTPGTSASTSTSMSTSTSTSTSTSSAPGTTAAPAPAPALGAVLVITAEMRGWIEPCGCTDGMLGGLPRRAALVERLRARGGRPILLDLGDLLLEPGRQSELKLEAIRRAYAPEHLGVAAIAAGELDLALGLWERAEGGGAGVPLVSTNLVWREGGGAGTGGAGPRPAPGPGPAAGALASREGPLPAVTISDPDVGALHVQAFLSLAFAGDVEVLGGGRFSLADPRAFAPQPPAHARPAAPPPAPIVVLYHGSSAEAAEVFAHRGDVLLVAAGHGVELPEAPRRLPGGALLVSPGDKGKYAAVVRIVRDAPAGLLRAELEELAALSDHVPDQHAVAAIYAEYRQRLYEENLLSGMEESPTTGGRFVGAAACSACHPSAFAVFAGMKHAHAFDSLVAKNAARDPECLACHSTGFGYGSGFSGIERAPHLAAVGCESCHGVGSNHADAPRPGFGRIAHPEALCRTCHDAANSPRFDFPTYWEKIRHGRER